MMFRSTPDLLPASAAFAALVEAARVSDVPSEGQRLAMVTFVVGASYPN